MKNPRRQLVFVVITSLLLTWLGVRLTGGMLRISSCHGAELPALTRLAMAFFLAPEAEAQAQALAKAEAKAELEPEARERAPSPSLPPPAPRGALLPLTLVAFHLAGLRLIDRGSASRGEARRVVLLVTHVGLCAFVLFWLVLSVRLPFMCMGQSASKHAALPLLGRFLR